VGVPCFLMDVITIRLSVINYLILNRILPIGSPLRQIFDDINASQLSSAATPVIVKTVTCSLKDAEELQRLAAQHCSEATAVIGQAIEDYGRRIRSR
jgi:hypothetical protein